MMMWFWNSASAVHATLWRMSQNDDATMVFHVYFISGCCVGWNLPAAGRFRPCVDILQEGHRRRAHRFSEADKTMGENGFVSRFVCCVSLVLAPAAAHCIATERKTKGNRKGHI
jgi:hypothetical protein